MVGGASSGITPADLPERVRGGAARSREQERPEGDGRTTFNEVKVAFESSSLSARVERFERDAILAALREASGSQREAARLLDMSLRNLQYKIKALGIEKLGYGADE